MARDLLLGKIPRDWSIGSLVLPVRQERRLLDKVDDVRHDARQAARRLQAGLLVLSAATGLVAVASILKERR